MLLPAIIRHLALFGLLLAFSGQAQAQLRLFPAERSSPTSETSRTVKTARTHEDNETSEPLKLPFFDDFSKPYLGQYPDTGRWENSNGVWVTEGMAIRPPTLNAATFDGLNASGVPYSTSDVMLSGYSDTLTSRRIDLSEESGGITAAERATVYLSFYYQWQGNLERPDRRDFLEVQFKSVDGWQTVLTLYVDGDGDPEAFYPAVIPVSGDEYFHADFQFRLRAYGRLSGPYDAWHVDYVYMNKGRDANDLSFPDRAISTAPGPLFGPYRAMPRWHLFSNDQLTPPHFDIRNMKNQEASINFRTEGFFSSTHRETGTTITHDALISKATPINITDNVLFAREHRTIRLDTLPDINDVLQFPPDEGIDSTLIRLTIALQTRDNIPMNRQPPIEPDSIGDYTPNYSPIQFTTNDTVTVDYILSSYYAYDDGAAEYGAGLLEPGNLVAYAFDIDTTYALKQDTLIGFDVYFPPYAVTSNQTIDFLVFEDDPDNPGYPGNQLMSVRRTVQRKGINQFQRISFLPALLIDKSRFYIGWRHPQQGRAIVGLDMGNDTGDRIFVNTQGMWYQNEDVHGSLMIRPIFGSGSVDTTVGIGEEEQASAPYPNPSTGVFFLPGPVHDVSVYNTAGGLIATDITQVGDLIQVRLLSAPAGMYIVRYKTTSGLRTQKIIIRP